MSPRRQTLQTPRTVRTILSAFYCTCCLALGVLLFTAQTANKALNVSDSPQRSSGTAKRNKATLSGAIKQVLVYGLIRAESL